MKRLIEVSNCWNTDIAKIAKHLASGLIKVEGLEVESETVLFYCKDGFIVEMFHYQDCCENVYLESADSIDNNDDIYTDCDWCEIEESTKKGDPINKDWDYSNTWTFYKMKTNKGYDTIRWYGTSNGYYSERIDFRILKEESTWIS